MTPTEKQIEEKLIEVVTSGDYTNVAKKEIAPSHNFTDDLGLDSLDFSELAQDIEDAFDLTIDMEDLETMKTVGDAVKYIATKLEGK